MSSSTAGQGRGVPDATLSCDELDAVFEALDERWAEAALGQGEPIEGLIEAFRAARARGSQDCDAWWRLCEREASLHTTIVMSRALTFIQTEMEPHLREARRLYTLGMKTLDPTHELIPEYILGWALATLFLARFDDHALDELAGAMPSIKQTRALFASDPFRQSSIDALTSSIVVQLVETGRMDSDHEDAQSAKNSFQPAIDFVMPEFAEDIPWAQNLKHLAQAAQAETLAILGSNGTDSLANFQEALRLLDVSRPGFEYAGLSLKRHHYVEGWVRGEIGDLGVHPADQWRLSADAYWQASLAAADDPPLQAVSLLSLGSTVAKLTELGLSTAEDRQSALRSLRSIAGSSDLPYRNRYMSQLTLVVMLTESLRDQSNPDAVMALASEASRVLDLLQMDSTIPDEFHGRCAFRRIKLHQTLAALGVDSERQTRIALDGYQSLFSNELDDARGIDARTAIEYASLLQLAGRHIGSREVHLSRATDLLEHAIATAQLRGNHLHIVRAARLRAELLVQRATSAGDGHDDQTLATAEILASPWRRQMLTEALQTYRMGIDALDSVRRSAFSVADRGQWMEVQAGLFAEAAQLAIDLQQIEIAAETIERGRARSLFDVLDIDERTPTGLSEQEIMDYRHLRRETEALAALQSVSEFGFDIIPNEANTPGADSERTARLRSLPEKREALLRFEQQIGAADPDFLLPSQPMSIAEITDLATRLHRPVVSLWAGPRGGAALIADRDGDMASIALPRLTEARVQQWVGDSDQKQIGWPTLAGRIVEGRSLTSTWQERARDILAELHDDAIAPVLAWLTEHLPPGEDGRRQVAFTVAGPLALLPIHAARWEHDGKDRFLADDIEAVFAPAAWVLDRAERRHRPDRSPVVAVFDPTIGDEDDPLSSAWESLRLRQLVTKQEGPTAFLGLQGNQVTLDAVSAALTHAPIAHLGIHGKWDADAPMDSALLLANGEQLTLGSLLGGNRLERARLMTLAACDSAQGHRSRTVSEDYLGFPAVLAALGAKSTLGALWEVNDLAGSLMLRAFYERVFAGDPLDRALGFAQRWLRDLDGAALTVYKDEAFDEIMTLPHGHDIISALTSASRLERPFRDPAIWAPFQVIGSPAPIFGPGLRSSDS